MANNTEVPPTPSTTSSAAAGLESEGAPRAKGFRGSVNRMRGSLMRGSLFRRSSVRSSLGRPTVSRYQDHFSLQAPTTYVRFHDSKSAARVIHNQSSQLVIEEKYYSETKKRRVTVKQMREESAGSLQILRLMYTLMGAFFLGFLFVFTMQVILFVAMDIFINLGITDMQADASYFYAGGFLFSLPILVHGFSLIMMLGGIFVIDLWKGHPLYTKFVCPNRNGEAVEWMFVVGLLVLPFCLIGATLMAQSPNWWQTSALYWFFSMMVAYLMFVISILVYEARVFFCAVDGMGWTEDFKCWRSKIKASVILKGKNAWGGYAYTEYASFGSPDTDSVSAEDRKFVIEGTLVENKRGLYTRFTQWSCLQGVFYKTLDTPRRIASVDDITDRRPYLTTYSWGLERFFCRPRKTRYIAIVKGPGAITRRQMKSTIICSTVGLIVVYFLIIALLVYAGMGGGIITIALVFVAVCSSPFFLGPYRRYKELKKLQILKKKHEERMTRMSTISNAEQISKRREQALETKDCGEKVLSPVDEEAAMREEIEPSLEVSILGDGSLRVTSIIHGDVHEVESESDTKKGKTCVRFDTESKKLQKQDNAHDKLQHLKPPVSDVEWTGFQCNDAGLSTSVGVYAVSEQDRITEPTDCFCQGVSFFYILFFGIWPTLCLYSLQSWQLATIYLVLASAVFLRYFTNAEVLIQEKGQLMTPDDDGADESTKWDNQSRLSQITASTSRQKSYYAWRVVFLIFGAVLIFLGIFAVSTSTESKRKDITMVPAADFYYEPKNSLHYTSCVMHQTLHGNLGAAMQDYMFLASLSYHKKDFVPTALSQWYGEGIVINRDDIVAGFREAEGDTYSPVSYELFTSEVDGRTHAAVSIRGSQNGWDWFADLQLWGAAALLQVVRALLPFGAMWNPILDEMVVLLSTIQTGTIKRLSFYKSTTSFADYLVHSGNYTSVVLLGHSLGGGLAIISGAQTGVQAVALSGPNALISRHRFDVTANQLEQFTFNIIPDRDPIAMIDDPTKNIQRLECRAPHNTILGCHSDLRSLCEVQYTCGSGNRPTICECVTKMNYPPPERVSSATPSFDELCMGTGYDGE